MINYVMALLILTIRNSQCLSTRFSQNALQTCKSLNKVISFLIFNSDEKKKFKCLRLYNQISVYLVIKS